MAKIIKRPGLNLNREAYIDSSIFLEEQEKIFCKNWLLACHISEIPNHGDFITIKICDISIIIINNNSVIKAFHNICRHKGCNIVDESSGNRKSFVCPYHSWVYGLNGKLISARGLPKDISVDNLSLFDCLVGVCGGFVFVCLEKKEVNWNYIKDTFDKYFSFYNSVNCIKVASETYLVKANWKILIENFEECYHCNSIHPEYSSLMAHAMPESTCSVTLQNKLENHIENFNLNCSNLNHPYGIMECKEDEVVWAGRFPMKVGVQSQTKDGKLVSSLMGNWMKSDGGISSLRVRPCSYILGPQDYLISISFLPVSVEETEVKLSWYLDNITDLSQEKINRLTWLWKVTAMQDNKICERTHSGVKSLFYKSGPLSSSEDYVESFHRWYINQLGM